MLEASRHGTIFPIPASLKYARALPGDFMVNKAVLVNDVGIMGAKGRGGEGRGGEGSGGEGSGREGAKKKGYLLFAQKNEISRT